MSDRFTLAVGCETSEKTGIRQCLGAVLIGASLTLTSFTSPAAWAVPLKHGDIIVSFGALLGSMPRTEVYTRSSPFSVDATNPFVIESLSASIVDRDGRIVGVRGLPDGAQTIDAVEPGSGLVETLFVIPPNYNVLPFLGGTRILALPDGSLAIVVEDEAIPGEAKLLHVDVMTGESSVVASFGEGSFTGALARGGDGSVVYAYSGASENVVVARVDMETGAVTILVDSPIPSFGVLVGIAVDPLNGMIYLASFIGSVYSVDPGGGAVPLRENGGIGAGVAIDPVTGRLVVAGSGGPDLRLLSVDPGDGSSEVIEPSSLPSSGGFPSSLTVVQAQCNDGFDNDGDGFIDAADSQCFGPFFTTETTRSCGGGFTQAMVWLAPIPWVARRRRAGRLSRSRRPA